MQAIRRLIGKSVFGVLAGASLLGFMGAANAQTIPIERMDVVGIRLGMTEAEVMRALKAFSPKMQSANRRLEQFTYSDGVNGFDTPAFLSELEVKTGDSHFRIWFAGPPAEPRTYAIMRYSRGNPNPPSHQQFAAALVAKHGPATQSRDPSRGANIAQWGEPGKPVCAVSSNGNSRIAVDGGNETLLPPRAGEVLEGMAQKKNPHLLRNLGAPADVARCGAVLRYLWGGSATDPSVAVPEFYVWLVDQGKMVANGRQSTQWVRKLEADAIARRQGKAVTPKL